jgi:hypothetical protein
MGREDEIRLIAYRIWEEEGCINGHDCDHWFQAEMIWEQQQKQETVARSKETSLKKFIKQNIKTKEGKTQKV